MLLKVSWSKHVDEVFDNPKNPNDLPCALSFECATKSINIKCDGDIKRQNGNKDI